MTHAESFYDGRVEMRYDGLDRTARYRVRVVYAATSTASRGRCASTPTARTRCTAGSAGGPSEARGVRRASVGDGGWRADAHLAAGARRGRRGTREPDRRGVAAARAVARDPVTTPGADARWENPVRRKLRNGEPVFGVTLTTPSLDVAARAAGLGFDFLWIERAPITLETARHIVLATRGLGAMPVARLPVNELWTAKHALDMGMAGVIFPFTSTAALAQQAVQACQYPPVGRRGSGAGLAHVVLAGPAALLRLGRCQRADRRDHRGSARARRDRGDCRDAAPRRAVHRHERPVVLTGLPRPAGRASRCDRPSTASKMRLDDAMARRSDARWPTPRRHGS